jgi:hypothetical protein
MLMRPKTQLVPLGFAQARRQFSIVEELQGHWRNRIVGVLGRDSRERDSTQWDDEDEQRHVSFISSTSTFLHARHDQMPGGTCSCPICVTSMARCLQGRSIAVQVERALMCFD